MLLLLKLEPQQNSCCKWRRNSLWQWNNSSCCHNICFSDVTTALVRDDVTTALVSKVTTAVANDVILIVITFCLFLRKCSLVVLLTFGDFSLVLMKFVIGVAGGSCLLAAHQKLAAEFTRALRPSVWQELQLLCKGKKKWV